MSRPIAVPGHLLTPQGFVRGRLLIEGDRVAALDGDPVSASHAPDSRAPAPRWSII